MYPAIVQCKLRWVGKCHKSGTDVARLCELVLLLVRASGMYMHGCRDREKGMTM